MYQASVPVFVRMLTNLSAILDKAQAHAEAKKFDSSVLLGMRLFPDMLPLSAQVQIACDGPKLCCARITGADAPKFEDKEASIAELKTRIANTIAFLKTITAAQLDGTEEKDVVLKLRGEDVHFKAQAYLLNFAHPNLYFHVTTAYNILRHNGVEIGKMDFIGPR
jgi:hypothetical protein